MPLNTDQRYKAHVHNLRAVDSGCTHIFRELKRCIATRQTVATNVLLKTFVLLIGAWSEVRLLKLLHEPHGFLDPERDKILGGSSKIDQWKLCVELGFRRRYGVRSAVISRTSFPLTAYLRYQELNTLLEHDLRPIIEIRNKLAHGQWERALNNDLTDVSQAMMALLNTENALSANFKKNIVEALSRLVNDLVVGGNAFDRDFDVHYRTLEQARTNLRTRSYQSWCSSLQSKFERGTVRRGGLCSVAQPTTP
jgi:hypothetical protein